MSRIGSWFLTQHGRMFTRIIVVTSVTTATIIPWLPNGPMLHYYQQFVQHYKNGFPVSLSKEVNNLIKEVEKDIKRDEEISKRIKYFTVFGFDVFHAGSLLYKNGALVGLPISFSYKSSDDIDKRNILVGNKTVHWTSPDGLALESSLLLTDSAKKFAIAREILSVSNDHVTIQSAVNGGCGLLFCYLAYSFNARAKALQKPFKIRATLYTILGTFVGTLWLFLTDVINVYQEDKADEEASKLGIEYTRGAVEFYTRILQRNVALRSLLGDEGIKLYTATGNDRTLFRNKHVPFTVRRDLALRRYETLTGNQTTSPEIVST